VIAERSLVVRDGIRLASPLAAVVAVALFFSGHNQPGGGFAAGLVLGGVVALRHLVGMSTLRHPIRLMSFGGAVAAAVVLFPLLIGDVALDQYVWQWDLPVLGKVKWGTALLFDLGVTSIVVGLIAVVVDGLDADPENPRRDSQGDVLPEDALPDEVTGSRIGERGPL